MGIENDMIAHNEKPRKSIVSGTFAEKSFGKIYSLGREKGRELYRHLYFLSL